MHEHLRNIQPSWVAFGWFLAAAITSLLLLALAGFGLAEPDSPGETLWVAAALLVGFFGAGFIVGTRAAAAPVLHGVAIGLFSIVAWFLINVFFGEPMGQTTWRSLEPEILTGLLVLQGVAAVVGARIGVRWTRTPPDRS